MVTFYNKVLFVETIYFKFIAKYTKYILRVCEDISITSFAVGVGVAQR